MAENSEPRRQLWILGTKPGSGREEVVKSYLEAGGYTCSVEQYDNLAGGRPLGVVLLSLIHI